MWNLVELFIRTGELSIGWKGVTAKGGVAVLLAFAFAVILLLAL
jgi:hypothetical protein